MPVTSADILSIVLPDGIILTLTTDKTDQAHTHNVVAAVELKCLFPSEKTATSSLHFAIGSL